MMDNPRARIASRSFLKLITVGVLASLVAACDLFDTPPPAPPPAVSSVAGYVSLGAPANSLELRSAAAQRTTNLDIVPGLIIVKSRLGDQASATSMESSMTASSLRPASVRAGPNEQSYELKFAGVSAEQTVKLAEELQARDDVVTAEVVPVVRAFAYPNDPLFSQQWGLAHIGAQEAWIAAGADRDAVPSYTIAVLDSGSRAHPDVAYLPGLNLIENNYDTTDYSLSGSSHGTHVAGIAGARVNNNYGVAGVSPNARILPVKVLDHTGSGALNGFASAIRWAAGANVAGLPVNPNPAKVINISAGSEAICYSFMQEAIDTANSLGAMVVVAAGNESINAALSTPANCAGVVTVGASGPTDSLAGYSNYGPTVNILAPGGDAAYGNGSSSLILSTDWDYAANQPTFRNMQGTSMATPFVAGALALIRAMNPSLTPVQALDRITSTAAPVGSESCGGFPASYCGAGVLDLAKALGSGPSPQPATGAIYVIAGHCTGDPCHEIDTRYSKYVRFPVGTTESSYSFTQLRSGIYDLWAFIDLNGNGQWDKDSEPYGEYPTLLRLDGRAANGIDIVIPHFSAAATGEGTSAEERGSYRDGHQPVEPR